MRRSHKTISMAHARIYLIGVPLLLAAVTLAAYAGTFQGDFQFDDFAAILRNPHLDRWQTYVGHLDHMVRPVLYATLLVDRSLYGDSATGYHLLNLLLHLSSGLLVYRILTHAVTEKMKSVPFWTALFFLIHPIQTETVTYISGRASGLMAFFYLFAFFLYIKASECRGAGSVHRVYLSGAVASCLLSLGSKETAATFPLALLLWDVLIGRLDGVALRKRFLSDHLPFWFALLAWAAWAWWHPRYSMLAQFSLTLRPLWDNFLSEIHAAAYALILFFCPWKQNFDHDLPEFHSLLQWPLPLDLLLLFGLAAAGLVSARRIPLIAFGAGWFFLQLVPTSLIPRADLLSERNLYLASIGPVLVVVVFCARLMQRHAPLLPRPQIVRFGASGLATLLVFVFCLFTYQRNLLYRDQLSLWSDTVRKSPDKARPHNNLGHSYALQDDWDRAIEEFRIAAQLNPDYTLAQKNLRDAYLHRVGRQ